MATDEIECADEAAVAPAIAQAASDPAFAVAKKVQEQVAGLANNLGRLNNIYGNMLSAMQGR